MKKILIILILVAIFVTGTAFADYPDGLGIGAVGGFSGYWEGRHHDSNWALSLKLPDIPIFWAFSFDVGENHMGVGLRGDYYLYHQTLAEEIFLDWYLGLGAWGSLGFHEDHDPRLAFGVRLPIGISFQPIDFLEFFIEIAPTLGIRVMPDFRFPAGGWGGALGVRVWL